MVIENHLKEILLQKTSDFKGRRPAAGAVCQLEELRLTLFCIAAREARRIITAMIDRTLSSPTRWLSILTKSGRTSIRPECVGGSRQ
jgi:hypothetical protein